MKCSPRRISIWGSGWKHSINCTAKIQLLQLLAGLTVSTRADSLLQFSLLFAFIRFCQSVDGLEACKKKTQQASKVSSTNEQKETSQSDTQTWRRNSPKNFFVSFFFPPVRSLSLSPLWNFNFPSNVTCADFSREENVFHWKLHIFLRFSYLSFLFPVCCWFLMLLAFPPLLLSLLVMVLCVIRKFLLVISTRRPLHAYTRVQFTFTASQQLGNSLNPADCERFGKFQLSNF